MLDKISNYRKEGGGVNSLSVSETVSPRNFIPKIIHYCWMGRNPLTELASKCIASWKKYCPDYEIIEWNEDNFDIHSYAYAREAYSAKKWAFVSDVVRLYALVNYGGIYMDTDVEVLRPLDDLLRFHAVSGFETDIYIPTGLMACEKGHSAFAEFLKEYDGIHFVKKYGKYDMTTNVIRITNACLKYGLRRDNTEQTLSNGFHILPNDYLCPKSYITGKITLTENTYTIHHFAGSWLTVTEESLYRSRISQIMRKIRIPKKLASLTVNFLADLKFYGVSCALGETIGWFAKKFGLKKEED